MRGNPRRVSCAIKILSFQNFYEVLKTCSPFSTRWKRLWAGAVIHWSNNKKEGRPLERRECETRYELAAAILPPPAADRHGAAGDGQETGGGIPAAGGALSVGAAAGGGSGRWRPSSPRRNWRPCATSPLNFPATPPSKHYGRGFFRCGVASGWDFAAPLW